MYEPCEAWRAIKFAGKDANGAPALPDRDANCRVKYMQLGEAADGSYLDKE